LKACDKLNRPRTWVDSKDCGNGKS